MKRLRCLSLVTAVALLLSAVGVAEELGEIDLYAEEIYVGEYAEEAPAAPEEAQSTEAEAIGAAAPEEAQSEEAQAVAAAPMAADEPDGDAPSPEPQQPAAVQTVALTEVFRQAQRSAIIRNAHAVNEGKVPELQNSAASDFFFLPRRDPVRLVDTVVELCKTRLPDNMGIPAADIQVLTPTRKGATGTASLNRALQAALNPPAEGKRERIFGEMVFREGDRVMQTRNDYDVVWEREDGTAGTGVFNGDVGQILQIDPGGELLTVAFDDRVATYTADMLTELDMAYAMTVHKAQGSEYRGVVFVAAPCAPGLEVRGVLYTAITRARELLIVVGDDSTVRRMTENDKRQRRYSGLRWRLAQDE